MIVVLAEFTCDADQPGFLDWFDTLVRTTQSAPGCLRYDLLIDPARTGRCTTVEVWADQESHERYLVLPHHLELVATGTLAWGMRDFEAWSWQGVAPPLIRRRADSHSPSPGKETMNALVADWEQQPPSR